ncbi:MAG TPA: nitrous oxide reductase family maturation protein NosD [Candidatus Acidoferrum sp.]|nr:nitrous oxide reductase family maturation protein NosD [Candidatus Acidoferrum sp.]
MKSFVATFLLSLAIARGATLVVTNTIADTLALSQAGDTLLLVGPRTFSERVIVTKSVRLLGTNSPVLDGGSFGTPLTIAATNAEVRGLTIRNSGADLTTFDSAVMILSNNATVAECRIENDAFGIYIRGASNCRLAGNQIIGADQQPPSKRGNGIHLWKTRGNAIVANHIRAKRDGMYFSFADANLIAHNDVRETRFGIHYMYSHANRLLSNSLTANAVGATLMFSRDSLVQGNIVLANRRHGMLFKQLDRSSVVGNIISGHNRGLFIQQATQNRFEGNTIATNDIGVYMSNCSEQNVFVGNRFISNTDQVWQPSDEVAAGRLASNKFFEKNRGNIWSDYTGADRNHDGIGDTPYHETDVFGYILERHPDARALALSPAVSLLRKGEELMPLLDSPGVTDLFPVMNPSRSRGNETHSFAAESQSLLTSAVTKTRK